MSSKHVTALWDEVQGSCDLARLDQALSALATGSGASFETLVLDGWTPLQYLCANQSAGNAVRAEAISRLLRVRVPVNAVDENGWSALHLLCKNKDGVETGDLANSIQSLVSAKADVNAKTTDNGKTALHLLCENESITLLALEALLKARAHTSGTDRDGNTPLHYLAENSYVTEQLLASLLAAKADPNTQNEFQATPFHSLCQNSAVTTNMIQDLLRHKANPNLKNNIGSTPLHYLCQNYAVSVDKLQAVLQSKQVNVTLTNSLGKTAFESIPANKQDCIAYTQTFAAPKMSSDHSDASQSSTVGGEDASELPASLQARLTAWNGSLPPFDMAFYHAVCCEPAFESTYESVQEISVQLSESPSNADLLKSWERSLASWRQCIFLAYAAVVPTNMWDLYVDKFTRSIPSELSKQRTKVEDLWRQFPEASQRRNRLDALAPVFSK